MKKSLPLLCLMVIFSFGANFDTVKDKIIKLNNNAVISQKKIDSLDEKTKEYLKEFRVLNSKYDSLQAYNKQLQLQVTTKKEKITSLENQILSIGETKEFIEPLIKRMINIYHELVENDLPFLKEERIKRALKLKKMEEEKKETLSSIYREIMAAYKDEYDYSNDIEAYQGDLIQNGEKKKVYFLRIGRVGLYYLSLDGLNSGYYNKIKKRFENLDAKYLPHIKNAYKIAKKQAAPNVLILPINTDTMEKL